MCFLIMLIMYASRYGRGRLGGDKAGAGPAGICICPNCKYTVSHVRGNPCNRKLCPKCGTRMTRE